MSCGLGKEECRSCLPLEPAPNLAQDCWRPWLTSDGSLLVSHHRASCNILLTARSLPQPPLTPHPHPFTPQAPWSFNQESTYIFAVFRLGEVDQVIIIHVLGVEQVAVLLLAEVLRVNPVGPEEFLVSHAECLPYGLCDQLGLDSSQRGKMKVSRAALLGHSLHPTRTAEPKASTRPVGTFLVLTTVTRELPAIGRQESETLDFQLRTVLHTSHSASYMIFKYPTGCSLHVSLSLII